MASFLKRASPTLRIVDDSYIRLKAKTATAWHLPIAEEICFTVVMTAIPSVAGDQIFATLPSISNKDQWYLFALSHPLILSSPWELCIKLQVLGTEVMPTGWD